MVCIWKLRYRDLWHSVGCGVNVEVLFQGTQAECWLPCEASSTGTCLVASLRWNWNVSLRTLCVSHLIHPVDVTVGADLVI